MEKSYGRILPGFVVHDIEEGVELSGKMLSQNLELSGWSVDERGFLSEL